MFNDPSFLLSFLVLELFVDMQLIYFDEGKLASSLIKILQLFRKVSTL